MKFAYYFYCYTNQNEDSAAAINKEGMDEAEQMVAERMEVTTSRLRKMFNAVLHINFLMPVLVIVFMLNPLCKNLLVPHYLSQNIFFGIKIMVLLVTCVMRGISFKEELQF